MEISPKGEEKRFANPTPRGDRLEWFGTSLSHSVSLFLSLSLSHTQTHTQADSPASMLISHPCGLNRWDPGCRRLVLCPT